MTERKTSDGGDGEAAELAAAYSVLANVGFAATKYVFGTLSGSLALMADAAHSLSDVISSATVLVGLKLSRRKSAAFPYGLYKVENLVALLSSAAIFVVAYELARRVVLGARGETQASPWAIAAVIVLMVGGILFSRYELRVARSTGSPALEADGRHIYTDVLSSAAVLVSLVGALFGLDLDRVATVVVVVFVARTGWHIGLDAVRVLLDASVSREVLNEVETTLLREPLVGAVKDLRGRNSGAFRFIEATVVLNTHDLDEAHVVSQRLEEAVRMATEHVDRVVIHAEPPEKEFITYAVPLGADGQVSPHFGEAEAFALVRARVTDHTVASIERLPNEFTQLEHGKGIRVAEMLVARGADVVFAREDLKGKGPVYVLADVRARLVQTSAGTVEEALRAEGVVIGDAPQRGIAEPIDPDPTPDP